MASDHSSPCQVSDQASSTRADNSLIVVVSPHEMTRPATSVAAACQTGTSSMDSRRTSPGAITDVPAGMTVSLARRHPARPSAAATASRSSRSAPLSPCPPAARYSRSMSPFDATTPVAARRLLATATGPHSGYTSFGPVIHSPPRDGPANAAFFFTGAAFFFATAFFAGAFLATVFFAAVFLTVVFLAAITGSPRPPRPTPAANPGYNPRNPQHPTRPVAVPSGTSPTSPTPSDTPPHPT